MFLGGNMSDPARTVIRGKGTSRRFLIVISVLVLLSGGLWALLVHDA
jgi:hypothetical protein